MSDQASFTVTGDLSGPVSIRLDQPKTFTLELTEAAAKSLREDLHPLMVRNMIGKRHSSVLLADSALAHFGLRFDSGFFVPDGQYLDLVHSRIVPDGHHIDPVSKEIVETPAGKTYDRTRGQLIGA